MTDQDSRAASRKAWLRALALSSEAEREGRTLPERIIALGTATPDALALTDLDESVTYRQLATRIERYARWARAQGFGPTDTVCVLVPNCADYLALWLGIARAGAAAALINTNLRGAPLMHAITVASPLAIVIAAELADAMDEVRARLDPKIAFWAHRGAIGGYSSLEDFNADGQAPLPAADPARTALFIYTSGTTGLPKAAKLSHRRLLRWASWFAGLLDVRTTDRLYDCLPLYHSTGGIAAAGAALLNGACVIIRPKFSARAFWQDVRDSGCTLFCYIGELCRYLADGTPSPHETEHKLRLCFGNGLGEAVWRRFQARFDVPRIVEFYASTEGTFSLYNCEDEPGSIGRIPRFLSHRMPVVVIKVDPETGEPLRDEDGNCLRAAAGEPGEAIGRLEDEGAFEGYSDRAATARKILRNVFRDGDTWYRSGDLMRQDARGFFYFVDRLGEGFRFKGENVSSEEVRQVLLACPCIKEAAVYGVSGPDWEGRAPMAALVAQDGFSLQRLHRHLSRNLPGYARPKFLRLCTALDTTATFKLQKQRLVAEGFDPSATTDPLYRDDGTAYVPMEDEADEAELAVMVPRGGIEPPTRGFSVRCSTD